MRILVVCQYYFPEPFRVNDICEEMVKRGHEVTVVTGEPNYPEGKIYKGYENHQHSDEIINGVTVHRCPIIPRKTGVFYRFLNYFSYSFSAKKYIKNQMAPNGKPFDIVFVNQLSPVMMAEPGILYKNKYNVPLVLYCLDLWPESIVAGGISRGSFIYTLFQSVSARIYQSADLILISSRLFREYLENHFDLEDGKIEYLPQYAENLFDELPFKDETEITNLVFAGNVGEIQSVETIIKAARSLQDKPVCFHIVGGGTDLDRIKRLACGLNNVIFYGRRSIAEMPELYAKADAMLVTLRADPVLSMTLPGKVQSYMAVGKPIIGAINGETAEIIKSANCGFCGSADDANELVLNIEKFIKCENKKELGKNARLFYEEFFDRSKFMDYLEASFCNALNQC